MHPATAGEPQTWRVGSIRRDALRPWPPLGGHFLQVPEAPTGTALPHSTTTPLNATAMPEHPIIQLVRRPIIAYLFGVLSAILILMLSQLIDGGLIIRLMGAMPKWRAVDLSSHDTFDPTCQYRYKVSNKKILERNLF